MHTTRWVMGVWVAAGALGCAVGGRPPSVGGEALPAEDGGFGATPPRGGDAGLGFFDGGPQSGTNDPARFGPTVEAAEAPPAISGGTLTVLADERTAVASDPERDRVYVVDLTDGALRHTVDLRAHDEPGRVVEGRDGRVYVALRRGGAVVEVDTAEGQVTAREAVCAAPRGLAYDGARGALHVACATGELLTFTGGLSATPTRALRLDDDLRDVVILPTGLAVSRFRAAQVLLLDDDGQVQRRVSPNEMPLGGKPSTAWRMRSVGGRVLLLHQLVAQMEVSVSPGGYGSSFGRTGLPCGGPIVQTAMTEIDPRASTQPPLVTDVGLPLATDFSLTPDGALMVAATGNAVRAPGYQLRRFRPEAFARPSRPTTCAFEGEETSRFDGQIVSVVTLSSGRTVVQTREPATLRVIDGESPTTISLASDSRRDTGHDVFHAATSAGLACASCHPEGGDDGVTWNFQGIGPRRTQSLRGGLGATAPFHWNGDMADFDHLASEVFSGRMLGGALRAEQVAALRRWIDAVPNPVVAPADDPAVARGRAVFNTNEVGCAGCHSGDRFTNNLTVDVGTGGAFQVPSLLGLRWRAPYMHAGCAQTLEQRLDDARCGGGEAHGHTAQLTAEQRSDLLAYLRSL